MIKVELKLQPEGKSQEVDGLLWGRNGTMKFLGMTTERDGLIGRNGTYLFRPVCYDAVNCFVPNRCNTFEHPSRNKVQEFPDSDPVLLVKIEAWYSESEIDRLVLGMRQKWPKQKKADLIETGKGLGLDADTLAAMKKADIEETVLRRRAQETETATTTLYIQWYMAAVVGKDEADKRLDSIRYAVKYRNNEVLYLSDLEWLAPQVELEEDANQTPLKESMSQREAADHLDIDPRTLRRWVKDGLVPEHRHRAKGKPWYFRNELDASKKNYG